MPCGRRLRSPATNHTLETAQEAPLEVVAACGGNPWEEGAGAPSENAEAGIGAFQVISHVSAVGLSQRAA